MDRRNSQNSYHYPRSYGTSNSSASWQPSTNPDEAQFSQTHPEYDQLTVVTNPNMPYQDGVVQVNQSMTQRQGSPGQNLPHIGSLTLSPNHQISQPLYHASAAWTQVSPSRGSSEYYPQCCTYNQAPQNISPSPLYSQHQNVPQSYHPTYTTNRGAQNFPHPPISRQSSLPTFSSKSERGNVKTRISKKKSGQSLLSLADKSTTAKRPPGRPKKEDLHQLDPTDKDCKTLLRKRRYAQSYRTKEKEKMHNMKKRLEMVKEFMKDVIHKYGEACRPMFNDFWNFYGDDDEDDSSNEYQERSFSTQQCSPRSI